MKTALPFLLLSLLVGCRASMQAQGSANLNGDASGSASADAEGSADVEQNATPAGGTPTDGSATANAAATPVGAGAPALLGARHDLRLVTERATNKCQCLNVAVGAADFPAFRWKAGAPNIDPETQLVVALTSEGQTCPGEPKESLGASYWGYRLRGNDVVVFVESAGRGRPLTAGGIIPKPFGDGQVLVAPAGKKTPYGRGTDGAAVCKIGNPGSQRTKPISPGESGDADAPASGADPGSQ